MREGVGRCEGRGPTAASDRLHTRPRPMATRAEERKGTTVSGRSPYLELRPRQQPCKGERERRARAERSAWGRGLHSTRNRGSHRDFCCTHYSATRAAGEEKKIEEKEREEREGERTLEGGRHGPKRKGDGVTEEISMLSIGCFALRQAARAPNSVRTACRGWDALTGSGSSQRGRLGQSTPLSTSFLSLIARSSTSLDRQGDAAEAKVKHVPLLL